MKGNYSSLGKLKNSEKEMILKYNSKLPCVMKESLTFSSFKMVSVKF